MKKYDIMLFVVCLIGVILGLIALGWSLINLDWIIAEYGVVIAYWQIVFESLITAVMAHYAFEPEKDS